MTQEQMAEKVNVSTQYYRAVEKGNYCATWPIFLRICTALHLNAEEIRIQYENIRQEENQKGGSTDCQTTHTHS